MEAESADEEGKVCREIAELCDKLELIDNIIVTAGSLGCFIQTSGGAADSFFDGSLRYKTGGGRQKVLRHYPGRAIESIVNASGAGDAFTSGFITGMLKQKSEAICVSVGFQAAITALMSKRAVPKAFFDASHECWRTPATFASL
jgi:sugar/nucleoside kinase (ribokinase family)